jgi:two-component system CheB/CheR fusion protein
LVQEVADRSRVRLDAVRDFLRAAEPQEVTRVQTANVVDEVLRKLSDAIERNAAELQVGALLPVLGRRNQVETLFTHLIDNALKYSRASGVRISVSSEHIAGRVLFEIGDDGPGIPDGQSGRALRLFQRLHGGEIPGNGVGLALCRKIVETAGGKLLISARPGGGTNVRFTLPMAPRAA